ncbi:MAG TPA: OmpH family outer membrane protein [Edaphobacter sp.]|jgi:outer membrane protein|nr:OmpH family outer membrane protein [Edaphobacter sp.]
MNRTLVLVSALGAGLMTAAGMAQAPAAMTPATPAPQPAAETAPAAPQPIPAKIALVAFEQAVLATNEGQRAIQEIQTKYKPKKDQIDALSAEVDTLKKQLQSAPTTLPDAERATRLKTIDTKEKQLTRNEEDAQTAYNAELQETYGKLAPKVSAVLKKYVSDNGYTILLDVSSQQSNVMWIGPNIDVTQAVVTTYNTTSGIAPPVPSAPSAPAPTRPHPATTTPKPAAPKQ